MSERRPEPKRNPLLGIVRVAIGRADGLEQFGRTVHSFLSSLAPLLAFPLAGALIELARGGVVLAITTVALTLVVQLAPPVVSHALARLWKREAEWLHYATAYNCCFWILPLLTAVLILLLGSAVAGGLSEQVAANAVMVGIGLYSLWLHWFLARHALSLSLWRSVALVVIVNVATAILAIGPSLIA